MRAGALEVEPLDEQHDDLLLTVDAEGLAPGEAKTWGEENALSIEGLG